MTVIICRFVITNAVPAGCDLRAWKKPTIGGKIRKAAPGLKAAEIFYKKKQKKRIDYRAQRPILGFFSKKAKKALYILYISYILYIDDKLIKHNSKERKKKC